jgi:hypothetical protein
MRELMALGFEDAGSVPDRRKVRFEGKTYTEGILESLVELGRQQMAVTLRENGCPQLRKAPSATTEPESAAGVEARPRLVS